MKDWKKMTDGELKAAYKKVADSHNLFNPKTLKMRRAAIPMGLVREMNKRKLRIY